jgi:hypothetical protein
MIVYHRNDTAVRINKCGRPIYDSALGNMSIRATCRESYGYIVLSCHISRNLFCKYQMKLTGTVNTNCAIAGTSRS